MTQLNFDPAPVIQRLSSIAQVETPFGARLDAGKADVIRAAATAYIELAACLRALAVKIGIPDAIVYGDPFPVPIMEADPSIVGSAPANGVILVDLANASITDSIPAGPFIAIRIADGFIIDAIPADDLANQAM